MQMQMQIQIKINIETDDIEMKKIPNGKNSK